MFLQWKRRDNVTYYVEILHVLYGFFSPVVLAMLFLAQMRTQEIDYKQKLTKLEIRKEKTSADIEVIIVFLVLVLILSSLHNCLLHCCQPDYRVLKKENVLVRCSGTILSSFHFWSTILFKNDCIL